MNGPLPLDQFVSAPEIAFAIHVFSSVVVSLRSVPVKVWSKTEPS